MELMGANLTSGFVCDDRLIQLHVELKGTWLNHMIRSAIAMAEYM